VIDDVLKLREALYAAEPFLTYLLKEGEMPRNNEPLRKALSMVREALDMAPPKKALAMPDDLISGEIKLTNLIENPDGSAQATFELDEKSAKLVVQIGLTHILKEAAKLYEEGK
jgi:hypothetical protein